MTDIPPIRLAALVVTCDRPAALKACVTRLLDEGVDHLCVVDNGQSLDGWRWLRSLDEPRLIALRPQANLGGAGGFALGLKEIRAQVDPDWVVVMDDDARPLPGTLPAFRAMDRAGAEGFAAAVFYPDGQICEMNRPLRNPFASPDTLLRALGRRGQGAFRVPDAGYNPDQPERPIDMASFVGLFLSRAALACCPGPDPRLFLYGDDLLYTLGLTRAGHGLRFAPALRFEHDCATLAGGTRTYRPIWKAYYNYRNGILLYRASAGALAWPLLALRLPAWIWAARRYGPDAPAYRRLLWAAVRDGVTGRLDRPPEGVPAPPLDPAKPLSGF